MSHWEANKQHAVFGLMQVLVSAILVVMGFMCAVKRYIDTAVLQYVPSYRDHHKKKDKKAKEGDKKKQSTMEILK